MCCIFTWMAWCFDASHRVVVFVMACLISSSVCCLLLTASLAGVAMGYNYSLAEYIDLKETNISVYIKRGVYDDEIADDFDWRRGGGGEPSISLKDNSGRRMGQDVQQGEQPLAAGRRRSDNSIFESDDQNKYEGGLMRLTSTVAGAGVRRFEPPAPPYTAPTPSTTNVVDGLLQIADSLPDGSQERLRAIQAAARQHEARKIELATANIPEDPSDRVKAIEANAQIHNARRNDPTTTTDKYAKYFGQLAQYPGFPGSGLSARKFMENRDKDLTGTGASNRFKDGVFPGALGWTAAGASKPSTENFFEYEMSYPAPMLTPPTVKPLLVRPEEGQKPRIFWDREQDPSSPIRRGKIEFKEYPNVPGLKLKDAVPKQGKIYNDYDESHGLPMRRKRSDGNVIRQAKSGATSLLITKTTSYKNNLNTNTLERGLDKSTNIDGTSSSETIQRSSNKSKRTKSSNSNESSIAMFTASNDKKRSDSIKQSKVNNLKHLTFTGKTKNVDWKPRKRKKKSEGYEYKNRGNKQTKLIWRRISDGVQEQWNRIILYINKGNSPLIDHLWNSRISNNSVSNSPDHNKSTFTNKLVAITNGKAVNINQCDIGSDTKTSLVN